jgi:hypothetical protein
MTIIRVSQSHYTVDLEGMTLEEIRALEAEVEADSEARAKAQGWKRTPCPWLFVVERPADEVGKPPWGHAQWHLDDEGKAVFDGANWDSSGQCVLEYALTAGLIALVTLAGVLSFSAAVVAP